MLAREHGGVLFSEQGAVVEEGLNRNRNTWWGMMSGRRWLLAHASNESVQGHFGDPGHVGEAGMYRTHKLAAYILGKVPRHS